MTGEHFEALVCGGSALLAAHKLPPSLFGRT